jgi:hypothetical protein
LKFSQQQDDYLDYKYEELAFKVNREMKLKTFFALKAHVNKRHIKKE